MTLIEVQQSITWLEKQIALIEQLLRNDNLLNGWGVNNRSAILKNKQMMEDMLLKLDKVMEQSLDAKIEMESRRD